MNYELSAMSYELRTSAPHNPQPPTHNIQLPTHIGAAAFNQLNQLNQPNLNPQSLAQTEFTQLHLF